MDRGRVGEERGSKETDGCPLTVEALGLAIGLAIGLWVVSCRCHEFNPQFVIEFTSELCDELRALIRKNYPREFVVFPDFSEGE
jgi:hypothetical protein